MLTPLIESVPDFTDWAVAQKWIDLMLSKKHLKPAPKSEFFSLEWNDIRENASNRFGYFSSLNWRKFVLAVYLADLASYSEPIDQVNFERLLFVMHGFPEGFRVWFIRLEDETLWPAGYTGWYPISELAFEAFDQSAHRLYNRFVAPSASSFYLYLFNYSVAPHFKKTTLSRNLIKKYALDILNQPYQGLSCITVSEDGSRIASRFGMSYSGQIQIDGSKENVFTFRRRME